MTVLECKVCGYIEFGDAPEKCPVCGAGCTSFQESSDAIKAPANPDELTEGDRKHIPQIVVVKECGLIPDGSCTDVHVRVGEIEHVMTADHSIQWIDFYVDRKFVSRVTLSVERSHPAAGLHLKASSGTVTAVECCNVHGRWMSETAL